MSATRGPAIVIEVRSGNDRVTLVVNGETIPTRIDSPQKIRDLRLYLRAGLEQFSNDLVEQPDLATTWRAFSRYTTRAVSVVDQLFGHTAGGFTLEKVLSARYPVWKAARRPAFLTIVADLDDFVPLELLPLFDTSLLPVSGGVPDLKQALRRFPSYSTIVRRQFPTINPLPAGDPDALVLDNEGALPLRFFWNATLDGARLEEKFFQQMSDQSAIEFGGPWPAETMATDELLGALATFLRSSRGRYGRRMRLDQVHHFSCHCDSADVSLESRLGFRDAHSVTIGELGAHLRDLARRSKSDKAATAAGRRPLVFLNACRSAQIHAGAVTSFPLFFMDPESGCGSRGVVGTEARVPDYFAAALSQLFYRYLLSGATLGEALYRAKWDLLEKSRFQVAHNPLGLLYTNYADPNIRVRTPNSTVAPVGTRPWSPLRGVSHVEEAAPP
jgi:hypothetical protein